MGYSEEENSVRVDIFKPSGKWYTTIALLWIGYHGDIFDEFRNSLIEHFEDKKKYEGMKAVCLEPYNKHSHPIMIDVDSLWEEKKPYVKLEW